MFDQDALDGLGALPPYYEIMKKNNNPHMYDASTSETVQGKAIRLLNAIMLEQSLYDDFTPQALEDRLLISSEEASELFNWYIVEQKQTLIKNALAKLSPAEKAALGLS